MRFVSLFSGIEAASVAWEPLGWKCAAFAEIEPHPCKVLKAKWPSVPNLGDVRRITVEQIEALGPVDVVIFGSPCQDLSLAGNREGLAGERSGLFHDAMRIVRWLRWFNGVRFALWENVFGAFSSNEGRDFALVVGALAGESEVGIPPKGWGNEGALVGPQGMVEWSTLDAQWFGVAQRRRRVFALADFGDWTRRPPVLLEPDRMRGDSAPSRQSWEDAARSAAHGAAVNDQFGVLPVTGTLNAGMSRRSAESVERGLLVAVPEVAGTLSVNAGPNSHDAGNFTSNQGVAAGYVIPVVTNAEGTLELPYLTVSNLSKQFNNQQPLVAFMPRIFTGDGVTADPISASEAKTYSHEGATMRMHNVVQPVLSFKPGQSEAAGGTFVSEEYAPTLQAQSNGSTAIPAVLYDMRVRRLTPTECERLQGFPDGHTAGGSDSARYKALGNSMAVPVIRWIGRKIEEAAKR